ncbi:molybdopterin-dependent oxidoreductase [Bermanella sp. R86510]|uniref:molybdopterin-dependent oxidoreductase n=1 Tax=unclassified Bermanella TaxID=2627862 RepID=UPI0037C771C2
MTIKTQTHYRTCNLCEAMCGIKIEHQGSQIISIKGDKQDPFSQGHICPKAVALQDLYDDPERLTQPLEKTHNGWQRITWRQAFDKVAEGIHNVQAQHGNDALGVYLGNPNVHNLGGMLTIKFLLTALNTHNRFSATSVDQLPHHIVSHHLFGHQLRIPVPDINRCQHMVILGANPLASNGSIMSVAGVKDKLKTIQANGGKVVVIDPRKSETAQLANQHVFIKPGTDAVLLLCMLREIIESNNVKPSQALSLIDEDVESFLPLLKPYTLEMASKYCQIEEGCIRQLIDDFIHAENAVMYGRMGVSVQEFGLLSQYCIMLINLLTGRLDEKGGMMFPTPAADVVKNSGPGYVAKRHSRVKKLPDFNGEFPVATLADEILTPGQGQIKAMLTVAGNPVLSTPNGSRLDTAFESLDFMVAIDYYLNETTRHADIILPPVSPLERDHYDLSFHNLAVHNSAKYSQPFIKKNKKQKHDWQIYLALHKRLKKDASKKDKLMRRLTSLLGPQFLLNAMLKRGPYGLTLKKLKKNPHGLDLGPLVSGLPKVIKHKDKKIHLHSNFYFKDLDRLNKKIESITAHQLYGPNQALLIGRRDVRTNNSWMHNVQRLVKGKNRCTLLMHPEQADRLGFQSGEEVKVLSRVGEVLIELELSDQIMPNVVSIPHGWGHNRTGMQQTIAEEHAGVSVNDLTDELLLDELCGNAAVNGVPVTIHAAHK